MSLEFDDSILPTAIDDGSGGGEERVCIPGDKLFPCSNGYAAGDGCYEHDGWVNASTAGYVHLLDSNGLVVEVRRKNGQRVGLIPFRGGVVTARVEAITLRFAKCSIICVEETLLRHEFNSTLRKEDIREKEKDKVEIYRCVQPGDVLVARVLGYGDSQSAYLLSIAEKQLGVIYARGQNGERMLPECEGVAKDPNSEHREERKMAIVTSSDEVLGQ